MKLMNITNIIDILLIILIFIILIGIWFIPVICSRGNENENKILWLTVFLGWIPFVWLALLISALLGKKK